MFNNNSIIFVGDIVLKDLKLKEKALNGLKLVFIIKAGLLVVFTKTPF